jgi:hypothetical protein
MAAQLIRSPRYCGVTGSSASLESGGEVARAVQIRIVEKALPADGGPGLLEVGPHDDDELAARLRRDSVQPLRVLERGRAVVDRAGSDHHDEPLRVAPLHDGADLVPRRRDLGPGRLRHGQALDELTRRR